MIILWQETSCRKGNCLPDFNKFLGMIIFLYGEDSYRLKEKLNEIVLGYKKIHKSGLNLIKIDAKDKGLETLTDNLRIASMFAEKKLAILINVFSSQNIQDNFLKELKALEESKDIIVVCEEEKIDQRNKLFKALQKEVKCQEFNFLKGASLRKWLSQKIESLGIKINPDAEDLLLTFAGNDLWRLSNEIKKLADYKKGSAINRADVLLHVRPKIEVDIFKTIDALASKNKKLALSLLHKHLDNGDNSLYLLSMIAYQFKNLLIIKENPKNSGLPFFVVQKTSYLCSQFTMEQLKKIYRKIFQIDSDIKTGKVDPETALDMLVAII